MDIWLFAMSLQRGSFERYHDGHTSKTKEKSKDQTTTMNARVAMQNTSKEQVTKLMHSNLLRPHSISSTTYSASIQNNHNKEKQLLKEFEDLGEANFQSLPNLDAAANSMDRTLSEIKKKKET
jgi:hypothetical protein